MFLFEWQGSDDRQEEQNTCEQIIKTKLLNGNSNGSKECDENFDADAILPPSPSKSSNTFIEPNSASNTSHDVAPPTPDSEKLDALLKIIITSILNILFC